MQAKGPAVCSQEVQAKGGAAPAHRCKLAAAARSRSQGSTMAHLSASPHCCTSSALAEMSASSWLIRQPESVSARSACKVRWQHSSQPGSGERGDELAAITWVRCPGERKPASQPACSWRHETSATYALHAEQRGGGPWMRPSCSGAICCEGSSAAASPAWPAPRPPAPPA